MRAKIAHLFLLSTVITLLVPNSPSIAEHGSCSDIELVFARGSGTELDGPDYVLWKQGFEDALRGQPFTWHHYELGSQSFNNSSYIAVGVGFDSLDNIVHTLSAPFSAQDSGTFNQSVEYGVQELSGYVDYISRHCPSTKFVLGGYSQGAMVITRTLPLLDSSKIIYAATFGDPNLYLPEGEGLMPPACKGQNLSQYRIYTPNCRAHSGILGTTTAYSLTSYSNKIGLWCAKKDIMCSNTFEFSNPIGDHLSYANNNIYKNATWYIAQRLINSSKSRKHIYLPITGVFRTNQKTKEIAYNLLKQYNILNIHRTNGSTHTVSSERELECQIEYSYQDYLKIYQPTIYRTVPDYCRDENETDRFNVYSSVSLLNFASILPSAPQITPFDIYITHEDSEFDFIEFDTPQEDTDAADIIQPDLSAEILVSPFISNIQIAPNGNSTNLIFSSSSGSTLVFLNGDFVGLNYDGELKLQTPHDTALITLSPVDLESGVRGESVEVYIDKNQLSLQNSSQDSSQSPSQELQQETQELQPQSLIPLVPNSGRL